MILQAFEAIWYFLFLVLSIDVQKMIMHNDDSDTNRVYLYQQTILHNLITPTFHQKQLKSFTPTITVKGMHVLPT